jgi:dynein heavy chain, axonemal
MLFTGCIPSADINMPRREVYGAQPPCELLRQLTDAQGFYDRDLLFWKDIDDVTLCAACGPPGGGRQEVTPRLIRHFAMLTVPQPSDDMIGSMMAPILHGFLMDFAPEVKELGKPLVTATVDAYTRVAEELLPTPAKSHYTFNLRDVAKVFAGMLMIRPLHCRTKESVVKLWMHELMRVFHDRLAPMEFFRSALPHDLQALGFDDAKPLNQTIAFVLQADGVCGSRLLSAPCC